jgi:hypothetical protein
MRSRFVFGLGVLSFCLGAWLSPRLTAQGGESFVPVTPERGQRLVISRLESTTCEVEKVAGAASHWVQCKDGMWRNLTNGAGYLVERTTK